jgi:hypothetical protein
MSSDVNKKNRSKSLFLGSYGWVLSDILWQYLTLQNTSIIFEYGVFIMKEYS